MKYSDSRITVTVIGNGGERSASDGGRTRKPDVRPGNVVKFVIRAVHRGNILFLDLDLDHGMTEPFLVQDLESLRALNVGEA